LCSDADGWLSGRRHGCKDNIQLIPGGCLLEEVENVEKDSWGLTDPGSAGKQPLSSRTTVVRHLYN